MNLQIYEDLPSTNPNSRAELYSRLRLALGKQTNAYSISHCPLASGFVISKDQRPIGLDLEVRSRIRPAVIKRISKKEELLEAPFSEALWVAKESAFKALNQIYPLKVLSQIQVSAWETQKQKYSFKAQIEQTLIGEGYVECRGDLILGIYQTPL